MRNLALPNALRRATLGALLFGGTLSAVPALAAAQTVSAAYAPFCGPGTGCGSLRFTVTNTGASPLLFETFTFAASGASFAFAEPPGGATYVAVDSFGPDFALTGFATLSGGGTQLFIDFLDPAGSMFPFELNAGASGYVEVALAGTPAVTGTSFTFAATADELPNGVSGAVSVVPEPATIVLMLSGLAAIAGGTGFSRRRQAV